MGRKTRRQLLGQHFLHEKKILNKIIEATQPGPRDLIIEIGPGQGALTFFLTEKAGQVLAIEKDYALVQVLEKNQPENLEIIAGDVLKLDLRSVIRNYSLKPQTIKLAGNLPYHISSQILFLLLEVRDLIERAVFLFQKELAERITAAPGTKKYAPLSILLQNYFDCQTLFQVKPGAFRPPPKVDSTCLLFLTRDKPQYFPESHQEAFFNFLKNCFAQRRKTLSRNLETSGYRKEQVREILTGLGLEWRIRAEALPPETLYSIYTLLKKPT
ncbi:MAG: 16S rRNA (adenine(1518)-N(6)/adenine(1519)-N(6))-dimethyltransferase RsmA [Candidatus Saccharicenans sp.]|nr:16S rRNA (adenine(1518)-N(6)/adenine(1519)-N(6))-dimethyltransferase RsmA [Candidatus Saccharicenans sp.]